MKVKNKSLIWMSLTLVAWALFVPLNAQVDDLYYDPSTDSKPITIPQNDYEEPANSSQSYSDDQSYYEEDEYAYEYSSRIRRFHTPTCSSTDYYDPMFVDLYHYDPYYLPGASIYSYGYNDYWRWRQWQAAGMWNAWYPPSYGPSWGVAWTPWGWSMTVTSGGYNPWYNPFVWNNYYYDPYWTWNGHNPYYYDNCAPGNSYFFYNNHNYYGNNYPGGNNGGYQPQTYVGPRRGGTTVGTGSGSGGGNGRNYTRLTSNTGSNGRLLVMDNTTKSVDVSATSRTSGRAVVEKQKEMARQEVERNVPAATNRKPVTTSKDPSAPQGRGQEAEKARPAVVPEARPSRQSGGEVTPTRSGGETRPSRPAGSGNENVRPSRPSSEDRPSRPSGGGGTETRPSRSSGDSGSGKSWDSGSSPSKSSSGSSSSGSSGRSGGGSSSGGSKSSGGGGGRGRN